mgnify:CR=1 FL=1
MSVLPDVRLSTDLCRDRAADDLCELQCRLDWVDLPLSDDVLRDILCETILAVIADNSIQLHLAVLIDQYRLLSLDFSDPYAYQAARPRGM